jgi:DNA adenine methylase
MGSKNRIAKHILPIILKDRKPDQWYVEPFCGGCNSLDKVANPRIGNDTNKYLIALLREVQTQIPFTPPHIGEQEYKAIQKNKEGYPDWLVGYVGFNLSFAAKFFGGYRRDKAGVRNYENEAQQNLLAQQNQLQGIDFYCMDYTKLPIPDNSIIYCDPPYKGTTQYKDKFDHFAFYAWCREMKQKGHTVFVSEYTMPNDFTCIWEKEVSSNLDVSSKGKKETEKLFELKDV